MESKTGFFNSKTDIVKDNEILYIPSMYNVHWSKEMNKIFSKYFRTMNYNLLYNSYLRYHKNTFDFYKNFFDKIRNDKTIKYILFQNILEDCDWRLFKLSDKKIYGFLHSFSGAETKIKKDYYEEFIVNSSNKIFCCSDYFKKEILKKEYSEDKFEVVGFPFSKKECNENKEEIFIFNHRLLKYKNHKLFMEKIMPVLLEKYPLLEIYITVPQGGSTDILSYINNYKNDRVKVLINKDDEYYSLLKRAKYGMSLSENDNFGTSFAYSLLDGIYYFVPNRLSFPEIAPKELLFDNIDDFFDKFDKVYKNYNNENINNYINNFLEKYGERIIVDKIKNIIKNGK